MPGIRLEPFKACHAGLIARYGAQEWLKPHFEAPEILAEAEAGRAVSVFHGPDFLGCAGLVPVHAYRATVWAIFSPGFAGCFLEIHLKTRAFLRDMLTSYPRIEAYIDPEFPQGVRWAKALGFREECAGKPYFFPDGRTGAEWVLLRGA